MGRQPLRNEAGRRYFGLPMREGNRRELSCALRALANEASGRPGWAHPPVELMTVAATMEPSASGFTAPEQWTQAELRQGFGGLTIVAV
jgi:hypothetical protein